MSSQSTVTIGVAIKGDGNGFKDLARDADGFKKAVTSAMTEVRGSLDTRSINFAAIATGISQAEGALRSMMGVMTELQQAYAAQVTAETELATVMRQRMDATDADIESIKRLASAQQALGVIGDEVQLAGAQQVATFLTQRSSIETLLPAMNNLLAQQRGLNASAGDAVSIANLMGKAMQGQTSALKRVGITFDESQEKVMKYGTESERAAMLAKIITQNVGEMNMELAKTDPGKQKQLSNAIGDVKEKLGEMASGAMPFVMMASQTLLALSSITRLTMGLRTLGATMRAFALSLPGATQAVRLMGNTTRWLSAQMVALGVSERAAAVATRTLGIALKGLLITTGVGIAIAALSVAVEALLEAFNGASDEADDLTDAERRLRDESEAAARAKEEEARYLNEIQAKLTEYMAKCKNFNGTKAEEKKLVDELNSTYGDTIGYFSSVSAWYKALCADSEAYCKRMVLEARIRRLANQLAAKEQERHNILYDEQGNRKTYDTTRTVAYKDQQLQGYDAAGNAIYTQGLRYEVPDSDLDKAQESYNTLGREVASLNDQINALVQELNGITLPVKGASKPPSGGSGGGGSATAKHVDVYRENASNLGEYEENIRALNAELQTATIERAGEINRLKAHWEEMAKAVRQAGVESKSATDTWHDEVKTLRELDENLRILNERALDASSADLPGIVAQIDTLQKLRAQMTQVATATDTVQAVWHETVTSLQDLDDNIQLLSEHLRTAPLDEVPGLSARLRQLEKLRDAYTSTAKESRSAIDVMQSGWGGIKAIDSSVSSLVDTLASSQSLWKKITSAVDAFFSVLQGATAIVNLVKSLTKAQEAQNATLAVGAMMEGTAAAAKTAAAGQEAAASATVTAANKIETESWVQLAVAKALGTSFEPFSASAKIAFILGAMQSSKVMAFANGGIAYGPTLGLFGEYAGASTNPEVVAPLDRLRSLIQPAPVELKVDRLRLRGRELVALINVENNLNKRSGING